MANRTVSLIRKCKTPNGWRRYPVAYSKNGKVKPNAVLVAGVEAEFGEGHYELRRYKGSRVYYQRIDGNASDALAKLKLEQKVTNAKTLASAAGVQVVEDSGRLALASEYRRFLQATLDRGSNEAAEVYKLAIDEFLNVVNDRTYVDEISRDDIVRFHRALRARGMGPRTVHNRHMSVRAFLLSCGVDVKSVAGKAPKYEKTMPEIYEPDELKTFFASLTDPYDVLLFDMLLTTGMREAEAMHVEWSDISWSRKTLHLRRKPHWNHDLKDAEQRELALSEDVLKQLRKWRESHPSSKLIFGRRGGRQDLPDGHLLRRLKSLAKRAGLDESEWFLHRFRSTYCTTLLRSGMDLRTVQRLMGHEDLASTMRYLRPAGTEEVQTRVNAIQWR